MLDAIFAVLLSAGIAFFAIQNKDGVAIHIASYSFKDIPLYIVVLSSLLIGLIIGWVINIIKSFIANRRIYGKDAALRETKRLVAELTKRTHQLEIENEELRGRLKEEIVDEKTI